jgi:hypothetical protein
MTDGTDPLHRLAEAHRTGTALPTLDQLGGLPLLATHQQALLAHHELPALIDLICDNPAIVQDDDGRAFLLAAAETPTDPITMEEVVAAFLAHPHAIRLLGDDLVDAWLDLSRAHLNLIGGIALESSARLVLAGAASAYGLLDRLRRLSRDLTRLDDNYALRTVRVAGAVAEHFDAPEIPRLLQQLLQRDDVAEDAAYELGMLTLRQALHTDSADLAHGLFLQARRHFTDAHQDEQRPDAAAFGLAIDAILAYSAGAADDIGHRLDQAVLELRMNLLGLPAGWRNPRLETLSAWQSLLDSFTRAQAADRPTAWLHAGAVINDLVTVYTAHRTLDLLARPDGAPEPKAAHGLHRLLAPRVERTLLAREGGLALVDQWLEELSHDPDRDQDPTTPIVREQALALRQAIQPGGERHPPKPDRAASSLAGLGLSAHDTQTLAGLLTSAPELADRLAAMTQAHRAQLPVDEVPIIASTYRDTQRQLQQQCPAGYTGQFALDIDRMLLHLLRFLDLRLAETQKYGGQARAYLRRLKKDEPRPLEAELGRDLRDFLRGQGLRVYLEVTNVGGGRVDIAWQPHDELITLELKRDWSDPSWDAYTDQYLPQAIAYQVAGPPLNFLVVLDLTDKPDGLAAIPACVTVRTVAGPAGDPRPRTVIMLRVQGNKRDPSDL